MSLQVGRGEVVGLIGRNGVGKITTLKTIMGLVNARQGEICSRAARSPHSRRIGWRAAASAMFRKIAASSAC